jgi:hypothetical protein
MTRGTLRKKSPPPQGAATAFSALSDHRREGELEAWICKRLALRDLFAGVTTREIRRDRLKVALLERGLTESFAGKFQGAPLTWRALYERYSGAPLD